MQNTYILLRNNSESAPLTLEDLKKIGLLPNDLLWVECQSVCWRHPDEITELKGLLLQSGDTMPVVISEELISKYSPIPAEKHTAADIHIQPQKVKSTLNDDEQDADRIVKKKSAPVFQDILLEDAGTPVNPTKQKTTTDKLAMLESLMQLPGRQVAIYAGLIIGGAVMMLIIMGTGKNNTPAPVANVPVQPAPAAAPGPELTENPGTAAEPLSEDSTVIPESYQQHDLPTRENVAVVNEKRTIAPVAKKPPANSSTTTEKRAPVNTQTTATVEKQTPAAPAETPKEKTVPAENIAAALKLSANEYNVAAFGGIKNLKMTLENNSSAFLAKVSVEIRYLNPEGAVVNTDAVDFTFVRPGSSSTVAVKKSGRGVKVDYRVLQIEKGQP